MPRAVAPENANGADTIGVRGANVVGAVSDHDGFVRVEPLEGEQASKELGLVVENAREIRAVDSKKMRREAEVQGDATREDFGFDRA